MATNTIADDAPPTTGPDAVDYDPFGRVRVGDDLLVYAHDRADAWVQSNRFVDLETLR